MFVSNFNIGDKKTKIFYTILYDLTKIKFITPFLFLLFLKTTINTTKFILKF